MERPPLVIVLVMVFMARFFPAMPLVAEAHSPATALFVLGDSSVNCGDNTMLYHLLPVNFSSFLCNGSHHRLLPDLIAENMGLPPIPVFYGGNGTIDGLMNGVNFGSAPATIVTGSSGPGRDGFSLFMYQTLSQQLRQVLETLQLVQLDRGPVQANLMASSSLFYLSFGQDDYVDMFDRDPSSLDPKYGRRGLARILVTHMIQAVKDLYNANVRKIVCMGVVPMGCAPRIMWEGLREMEGRDCVDEVNEIVSEYNTMLSTRLLHLNSELRGAQIVFCDIYRGMMEIIANPMIYGFENVSDACCGAGRFGGMIGCLSEQMACSDPQRRVWWDLYSPSTEVNTLLANWTWSGGQLRICEPITLRQLAS